MQFEFKDTPEFSGRKKSLVKRKVKRRSEEVRWDMVCVLLGVCRKRRCSRGPDDQKGWESRCVWGVMQNCSHLNEWMRCVILATVWFMGIPLLDYTRLLMAAASMDICASALRWFMFWEDIPHRHQQGYPRLLSTHHQLSSQILYINHAHMPYNE